MRNRWRPIAALLALALIAALAATGCGQKQAQQAGAAGGNQKSVTISGCAATPDTVTVSRKSDELRFQADSSGYQIQFAGDTAWTAVAVAPQWTPVNFKSWTDGDHTYEIRRNGSTCNLLTGGPPDVDVTP